MEADYGRPDWPSQAICRWVLYVLLWSATVVVCLFASQHVVMQIGGAVLGCALAASLPLSFATLFETAYARREPADFPIIACPCLGAVIVIMGVISLQLASPLTVWFVSKVTVDTPMELCQHLAGLPLAEYPRAVCIRHAFVKTGWEAGELACTDQDGHKVCAPAFVAAPIFNSKPLADAGLPKNIFAWAVTHGPHVIAAYSLDGSLCGYLRGTFEFDIYFADFHLAVDRAMAKYQLALEEPVSNGMNIDATGARTIVSDTDSGSNIGKSTSSTTTAYIGAAAVPLEQRPLVMIVNPSQMTGTEQVWLLLAVVFLCFCPCVGPVPIGSSFIFWCWVRNEKYRGRRVVPNDDYADDDNDTVSLMRPRR